MFRVAVPDGAEVAAAAVEMDDAVVVVAVLPDAGPATRTAVVTVDAVAGTIVPTEFFR